jgi:hypothetical protein
VAARKARQQYLASQGVTNVAATQRLQAARAQAPPVKGVARPPTPMAQPGQSPPGQPQEAAAGFTPDAEYLAAAAQRAFERTQALSALTTQGETDKGDTQEAIRRLLAQAPEQRQGIKQGANRAGLFYSGQLGKQLDAYEGELTQKQGDINLDFQRRENARIAARQAIESGMPLEEAAALAEAATRQIDRDTTMANAGGLAATPAPAAAAPTVVAGRRRPPARRRPSKALLRARRTG